jgi:hypothetical protein
MPPGGTDTGPPRGLPILEARQDIDQRVAGFDRLGYARRRAGDFEPADYFVPFVDLTSIERRRDKAVRTLTPTITKISPTSTT